ncbi:hypothetical protein NP493_11g09003 [Ridgeia piscesae]|uniref:Galaxin-like repeats domain-containing protein n=1 Tax=Ridgeia piscesae TaxID=27915 RepID=A0AAD9PFJ0_RIDPI|nr:hypothetical protein NP493_11g09003 [Ridgeia piscesae]
MFAKRHTLQYRRHYCQVGRFFSRGAVCNVLTLTHPTCKVVCVACRVLLTFLAVGWITTSDAWWFTKEKPIDEYKFADCEGKRYWTFNTICCEGVLHDRILHNDECCGGYAYNREYQLCCDGRPVSKEALEECPENDIDATKFERVTS